MDNDTGVESDARTSPPARSGEPLLVTINQAPAPGGTVTRRVELDGDVVGLVGDQVLDSVGWSWWWSAEVDGRTVTDRSLPSEQSAVHDLLRRWDTGDWPDPEPQRLTLRRSQRTRMASGGTVVKDAWIGDRWVGWVGDHREFTGSRFAGRRWWATWREGGDEHARWNQDAFRTREAACTALAEHIAGGAS